MSVDSWFPEFQDLLSSITDIEFCYLNGSRRLTAYGCQNGYIKCSLVDVDSNGLAMSMRERERERERERDQ